MEALLPVLKEFGLPLAFLALVVWGGWPLLKSLIESNQKLLATMLDDSEKRQAKNTDDFLKALQEMNKTNKESSEINRQGFSELHRSIERRLTAQRSKRTKS